MTHTFTGAFKGLAVNLCRRSQWRVSHLMAMEDLLQEAYLVFHRCTERYPEVVDAPQFMALYQTALTNHITDLARRSTLFHETCSPLPRDENDEPIMPDGIGELDNEGMLRIMVRQAPREIKMVLSLMLNAPTELTEVVLSSWRGTDRRKRGNGSERINRALGLPAEQDTMGMVRDYFSS